MPPLFHVDAFTDKPFAGNPAAVCLLPAWKDNRWLQAVAGQLPYSAGGFPRNRGQPTHATQQ